MLTTKLVPPVLPRGYVERSRLVARLDDARNHRLTLLIAPGGYGKTTLVAAWAHRQSPIVSWLSLDAGDDDPIRFWRHLDASLRVHHLTPFQTSSSAVTEPHPSP